MKDNFNKKIIYFLLMCTLGVSGILFYYLMSSNTYGPDKTANKNNRVIDLLGRLQVAGNQIVDQNGKPVALHGMSLFWSQWMGKYYTPDCIKWLRDDWHCTVIRAALGVTPAGYLENPEVELKKMYTVIDACLDLGIYVIVDWHDHNAHNHQQAAITFFKDIATKYGSHPNIIYEIYNEPEKISWTEVIKPYAESVIKSIRSKHSYNLILVGTPTWSQDVDIASQDPLLFDNIAYTLHFYASTHGQYLRDKATIALQNRAAIFVSEFGTCEYTGTGLINRIELDNWFNFMQKNQISWCNWSIADKNETSAALIPGASPEGGWTDIDLSRSGLIIRNQIRLLNESIFKLPGQAELPPTP